MTSSAFNRLKVAEIIDRCENQPKGICTIQDSFNFKLEFWSSGNEHLLDLPLGFEGHKRVTELIKTILLEHRENDISEMSKLTNKFKPTE